jgi:hypothetical protein
MGSRKIVALLTVALLAVSTAFSAPTWVSLGRGIGTSPTIALNNNTADSIVFTVVIPGFYKDDVTENNLIYQKMWFDEGGVLTDSGFPELPTLIRNIAIPECDSVHVIIRALSNQRLDNYQVYPAPKYNDGQMTPKFCKNDSLYLTSDYYPNNYFNLAPIDHFRDQPLVGLMIKPIWFSPDSGRINVFDSIQVVITFDNPIGTVNYDVGIFTEAAENMFINYQITPSYITRETDAVWNWCFPPSTIHGQSCDYLIITADFVYSDLVCRNKIQSLAQHRANYNGFDVRLVKVGDITDVNSEGAWLDIRNFIISVYDDHSSGLSANDNRLPFVLLVGDAWDDEGYAYPQIATSKLLPATNPVVYNGQIGYANPYAVGSDHFYAEMNNFQWSLQAEDLAIGRIAVGNQSDIINMVDKIIDYETQPPPVGYEIWKSNIMFQSGYEGEESEQQSTAFAENQAMINLSNSIPNSYNKCTPSKPSGPFWAKS